MQKACFSGADSHYPRPGSSTYASKRYVLGSPLLVLHSMTAKLQDGAGPASM